MPILTTKGAASAASLGFSASSAAILFIEDVFSTYLYTGNGSTQTFTNGIDVSGKGGLVWAKSRSSVIRNSLFDTARGANYQLSSNNNESSSNSFIGDTGISFTSTGFSTGSFANTNTNGATYVSWTFRKQPKFFDIVTYSGTGSVQNISHSLGSTPACMIVKDTTNAGSAWAIYHTSLGNTQYLQFTTSVAGTSSSYWNNTSPTSTQFTVGTNGNVNQSGATYVAYLFAHDAGGFGLTGSDNVISCGSFVASGSGQYSGSATINLGWEPQFVLMKQANNTLGRTDWTIVDNMRGWPAPDAINAYGNASVLAPNTDAAEVGVGDCGWPTATGFQVGQVTGGATYIYIAIRRGPMKVPTSGTSVFSPVARAGTGASTTVNTSVRPDAIFQNWRAGAYGSSDHYVYDRLRGFNLSLFTTLDAAEANQPVSGTSGMGNSSYGILNTGMNASGGTFVDYAFTRAPSFFDVVCYTGTGVAGRTVTHNLTVAPELMFIKSRSAQHGGLVYNKTITASKYLQLFFTGEGDRAASNDIGGFYGVEPTSSVFTVGGYTNVNQNGTTYVAFLFATCAGVSKVGTYTGTGTTLQIDCGFTSGARFVLIRRTSATSSDWYVWDTTRGIVAGNDPYLLLNSTAAEVTNTDYIDAYSAGFEISSTAPAAINGNGGTFIFLAIA